MHPREIFIWIRRQYLHRGICIQDCLFQNVLYAHHQEIDLDYVYQLNELFR